KRTIECFKQLGVSFKTTETGITINGKNFALEEPIEPLYFGNSGTTARLMLGVLAGQPFFTRVYGDEYLSKRPMMRVINPLKKMGALINGRNNGQLLPLSITGNNLESIFYEMPVKSAQVKSSILLATLYSKGRTTIIEKTVTRNHTENMLKAFGANIMVRNQ